jgi:hypothetical protein
LSQKTAKAAPAMKKATEIEMKAASLTGIPPRWSADPAPLSLKESSWRLG